MIDLTTGRWQILHFAFTLASNPRVHSNIHPFFAAVALLQPECSRFVKASCEVWPL